MPAPLRVLLVEDCEDDALLLVEALRRGGYQATFDRVQDREGMSRALADKQWDIILCDYSLPGFDAPAALELVHESKLGLPVIIVSGAIGEDVAVEALRLGADDYLLKHNLTRLVASVERTLHDAANRRARLAAEEARTQTENRLKLALEAATMGVWEWNLATDRLYSSPTCSEILGDDHPVETMADFTALIHPADAQGLRLTLRHAITGRSQLNTEFRVNVNGGHERWIATLAKAEYEEGRPVRMLGTIQDITSRKLAEQAIRERDQQFHTIVQTTRDGFWLMGINGRFLEVNEAACRMLGYTREEFLNLSASDLDADESAQDVAATIRRILANGSAQFERRHRRSDGKIIHVEISVSFLPDHGGRLFCFSREITERKHAEKLLRKNEQQLRALSLKLERLREDERTRISREIHDELGQMLTGLKMDLSYLERKITSLPQDTCTARMLERIAGARSLADETIGTVQKIAADLRPGVLDKLGLATALNYEARRFSERTGIRCEVFHSSGVLHIKPETSTALFRIFQEALTNVARHAQATAVTANLQVDAGRVTLDVIDNGIGIPPEVLSEGNGLGILGMKERSVALGGTIVLDSQLQGGTRVSVLLPLSAAAEKADYQL